LNAVVPALAILFDKTLILCDDTLSADLTVLIMLNLFIFYKVVCRFRAKITQEGRRAVILAKNLLQAGHQRRNPKFPNICKCRSAYGFAGKQERSLRDYPNQ